MEDNNVKFEFELELDLANEFMQFIKVSLLKRQMINYVTCAKDGRKDVFADVDSCLVRKWNQILPEIKYSFVNYVQEDGTPVIVNKNMGEDFKMQLMPTDEM